MTLTSLRRVVVPGLATLALALSACSAGNETSTTASDSSGSSDAASLSGQYTIGGSSAQEAAQLAWTTGFADVAPDVTLTYEAIGSGGGRENFNSGAYVLAGSDSYLVDEAPDNELTAATERCGGTAPIEVPDYVSPIAVVFNVDGVTDLNLAPETLAGIFAGTITSWDDPAIAADNPDATLPSADINPVHRSDESGTSGNFTNYLDTVAGDVWTAGETEIWPKEYGGEGAEGTSGVIDAVKGGTNSIGYADASQAGDLGQANIGVGSEFVAPSPEAAAKIFEVSPPAASATDTELVFDLDYKTEEAGTYPIVLTSYLIACPSYDDQADADVVKAYASYIVSAEGQQQGADEAGSSPLPSSVVDQAAAIVDQISGP